MHSFINALDHKVHQGRAEQSTLSGTGSCQAGRASSGRPQAATAFCLPIVPDTNQRSGWALAVHSLGQDAVVADSRLSKPEGPGRALTLILHLQPVKLQSRERESDFSKETAIEWQGRDGRMQSPSPVLLPA